MNGVTLNVRAGEIVGLAGVAGNGQRELADVITGLRKATEGQVIIDGEDITNQSPKVGIRKGMSHIPEDRTHVGTAPNLSVTDNVIMKNYTEEPIGKGWMVNDSAALKYARELKKAFDIIVPNVGTSVRLFPAAICRK